MKSIVYKINVNVNLKNYSINMYGQATITIEKKNWL